MSEETPNDFISPISEYAQKLVWLSFNHGWNPEVNSCKTDFAKIIDSLDTLRTYTKSGEIKRMCSIAITEAQTAQMWAVKAITWQD